MRVKRGKTTHRRHKKYLDMAKGFRGSRSKLYRSAREAVEHALVHSYIGRKQKKRDFRKLWIMRINAAAREYGLSYNRFMEGLKKADVQLNRKMLSEMAVRDKNGFSKLAELARSKVQ